MRYKARDAAAQIQRTAARRVKLHLTGFPTKNLVPHQRWTGPKSAGIHVAIVGKCKCKEEHRGRTYLVAVPVEWLKKGLTEEEFKALLARRSIGVEQFAAMVLRERRKDLKNAEENVLAALAAKVAPATEEPGRDRASRAD